MSGSPLSLEAGQSDIGSGEWDAMFEAVIARLRQVLAAPADTGRLRGNAADCVQALEQLHGQLANERSRALRITSDLMQMNAALSAAREAQGNTRHDDLRARHLALHDPLTALPNRQLFNHRLAQALRPAGDQPRALAVFFLDLDGFKPINDEHGDDTGDELLRVVAGRLKATVRGGDIVCRFGGDAFACLVASAMEREQLSQLARKLFEAVAAPLKLGALDLRLRPSIGIARCPADGSTAATLLKHADAAMFRAKRGQLGHAFFDGRSDS